MVLDVWIIIEENGTIEDEHIKISRIMIGRRMELTRLGILHRQLMR